VVLKTIAEPITENETTDRIAISISSMGVEFSSLIMVLDVDLREVTYSGHLHIVRSLDEVDTLESAIRNSPRSAA
jgi:hypothetical protein